MSQDHTLVFYCLGKLLHCGRVPKTREHGADKTLGRTAETTCKDILAEARTDLIQASEIANAGTKQGECWENTCWKVPLICCREMKESQALEDR